MPSYFVEIPLIELLSRNTSSRKQRRRAQPHMGRKVIVT